MAKRRQIIEIFAPTEGIKANSPTTIMSPRSQPTGLNMSLSYGVNQKEYGTSLYTVGLTALSGPCIGLYEAKYKNGNAIQAFTDTGVFKLASATWTNDGQVFAGSANLDHWTGLMYAENFVYNNGIDPIQVKASLSVTGTNMAAAISPNTYKAWTLAALQEHLCLYHTIEDGTEYPNRIRWSRKGGITSTCMSGGTAGYLDVPDTEGELQTAVPLGEANAVYANNSIHVQYWVGGTEIYRAQKTISGVGAAGRNCVASYKDVNYVISKHNFHSYHGGDDLRDIGDPIKALAFGAINNSAIGTAFVEVDPEENKVLFHVPTTGTTPDTVWVYSISDTTWAKLARSYRSAGRFARADGLTIGELVGSIGAQTWKFGEYQAKEGAAIRLYGDVDGHVTKYDKTRFSVVSSGTAAAQGFRYETPDLTGANVIDPYSKEKVDFSSHVKRWTQAHVDMRGVGSVHVFFSTNKGASYIELPESPLTADANGKSHTIDIDIDSKYVRLALDSTGLNDYAGITYVSVEFIPQGEY